LLAPLGIEKGKPFNPDARQQSILIEAANVGQVMARTIGRILAQRGAVDARQRVRRRPPRLGWYLPEVAAARAEVDRVDLVEGLVIASGPQLELLNVISLHGGLVGSWPRPGVTATVVTEALREQRSLVDATWPHRRVRAEVDLDQDVIRFYDSV
jgi:hypothetical protein